MIQALFHHMSSTNGIYAVQTPTEDQKTTSPGFDQFQRSTMSQLSPEDSGVRCTLRHLESNATTGDHAVTWYPFCEVPKGAMSLQLLIQPGSGLQNLELCSRESVNQIAPPAGLTPVE